MKSRLLRRVGILVVATLMVSSAVMAQGPFGTKDPWAQIHAKLDTIIAALTLDAPEPPTPGEVKLFTGFLFAQPGQGTVTCVLANLSTSPLTVRVRVRGPSALILRAEESSIPGEAGLAIGISSDGYSRCEFSFIGFAENVRANMQWHVAGSSIATVMEAR